MKIPELLSIAIRRFESLHPGQTLPEAYPDRCWTFTAGGYFFAINATTVALRAGPGEAQIDVQPSSMMIFRRSGIPIGVVTPVGGGLLEDCEDEVIDALQLQNN